jgi:type IV pilus assembly protein PilV
MKSSPFNHHPQAGTSLIEVLISILLLSFGILALGAMVSFMVQMPKLSGYRATAANLASNLVERIRANPSGFSNGSYDKLSSYDSSQNKLSIGSSEICAYPVCDMNTLATMDFEETKVAVRAELPAGGMLMLRDNGSGTASTTEGNLWIVWQEPSTYAALDPSSSDNCPKEITDNYTNPIPRCLYVRFKI